MIKKWEIKLDESETASGRMKICKGNNTQQCDLGPPRSLGKYFNVCEFGTSQRSPGYEYDVYTVQCLLATP